MYLLIGLTVLVSHAAPLVAEIGHNRSESLPKEGVADAVGEVLGNFIAVETGQVKDGEQIPVPTYRDGTRAKREDTYYFVSPNRITTSHSGAAGYMTCSVDARGYAHASFVMRSGESELDVSRSNGEKTLQKYYESIASYSRSDLEMVDESSKASVRKQLASTLKDLDEDISINYLAIALRTPKK